MGWWSNTLTRIFLGTEEIERGRQLDAQIDAFNRRLVEEGDWTNEEYEAYRQRAAAQSADTYEEQMAEAWEEGWEEGYENLTGTVKQTLAAPFRFTWDIIPWQIWAVLIGLLIYQLWTMGILQKYVKLKA